MGGTIDASSREGQGSVFQLILPYRTTETPVNTLADSTTAQSALNERLSGQILIAEDTPELQLLERRILESMGLTVTTASNGQEAVELAEKQAFDLILMDMQMPVLDGIGATQALRAAGNSVPIVALTANVMQKHRDAFNEAGCDGFLGKPTDKQELRKLLKHHLSQPQQNSPVQTEVEQEVDDELMAIFIKSTRQRKAAMAEALSTQEWQQIREIAHAIKGSATSFGYPQLSKIAESIQLMIDDEKLDEVPALAEELLRAMEGALP